MAALNCAGGLKKFDLRSGSKRHRHFVGLFNVPVQAPTRGQSFYGFSEKLTRFSRRDSLRIAMVVVIECLAKISDTYPDQYSI